MARQPREAQRGRSESGATLNPLPWALSAALLICAIPFAYQIAICPGGFSGSISPSQLFSFQCTLREESWKSGSDVDKGDAGSPAIEASPATPAQTPPLPSGPQRDAPTLLPPSGYVSYRVEDGIPRPAGSLVLLDGTSPAFSQLKVGDILQATHTKRMRRRPFDQAQSTSASAETCFQVIEGQAIADEPETPARSGGWLPVTMTPCPGA